MRAHNIGFDTLLGEHHYYTNRNVIVGHPYPGNIFSWKGNHGVAELSDFGPSFRWQQIYRDAADHGITVQSPRSREEIVFVVIKVDKIESQHEADEITGWNLVSLGPNGRPDNKFEILIIND